MALLGNRLRLAVGALGLFVLIALLAGAQGPKRKNPHASGAMSVPAGMSEVRYCMGCHTSGCTVPHPEQVKMAWAVNGLGPLAPDHTVTCGSCHTPGFRKRTDAFLARNQKKLCGGCHYGQRAIPNDHTSGRRCEECHLHGGGNTPASAAMRPTINSECLRCHYDGPITHPVGVKNTKKQARDLPLAADGTITCVTCHIGHNQKDPYGNLLRKDNRRGGLCLSCHDDL